MPVVVAVASRSHLCEFLHQVGKRCPRRGLELPAPQQHRVHFVRAAGRLRVHLARVYHRHERWVAADVGMWEQPVLQDLDAGDAKTPDV